MQIYKKKKKKLNSEAEMAIDLFIYFILFFLQWFDLKNKYKKIKTLQNVYMSICMSQN